jgi:hypothetical protein
MTTAPSRPLVLTNLTVIDVTRGQAKSDMKVMIEAAVKVGYVSLRPNT